MNDFKKDETRYQTGTVSGPRHHGVLVAMLLVAVVLLCGLITILGLLNVRLFVALKQQENSALRLQSGTSAETDATTPSSALKSDFSMEIQLPNSVGTSIGDSDLSAQQIYDSCIDSVVTVTGDENVGTGVVVDGSGYIVTNCHVVQNTEQIQVRLSDQRQFPARLVGTDPVTDLAVVYIEAEDLPAATFGDPSAVQVGDQVCAIGGEQNAVTNGTVSSIDDALILTEGSWLFENISGPLIDRFGQVVGISAVVPGYQGGSAGIAIPITAVKEVVDQLICQGYVSGRPDLGIDCEPVSERYQYYYDLPAGLYITEVITELAGASLEAGDILLTLDGQPVTTVEELETALYQFTAGDVACFQILRDGSRIEVNVTIEEATG